jgi:EAL domain-containing protein (putative c-di-GMP-specific phosphodiesterase class I)
VVFYYQPLAWARTHRVVGVEALARWEHPVRGLIEPVEFISLAEADAKTAWELTLLTVDRALSDHSAWGETADELTISINLSPVVLARGDLAEEFSCVLQKHSFPASRLAIEVTETALVAVPQQGAHALESLKQLGMTIMLDDFGAGYSSISRLNQLPIDVLKVDLHEIGPPPAREAPRMLSAIVELAKALEVRVVAERIEDDETWNDVAAAGCDFVQGSRLCPPLPVDQVQDWLQQASRSSVVELS